MNKVAEPQGRGPDAVDDVEVSAVWPRGSAKVDPVKLFESLRTSAEGNPDLLQQIADVQQEQTAAGKILSSPFPEVPFKDMPESVLVGRLGEICNGRLGDFPRAYAWPALLAVASAFLNEQNDARTGLYVALVGPVHSGKSQAIKRAIAALGLKPPQLLRLYSGSAEQLARRLSDAAGNPRLLYVDELAHLFRKAQIDRSSFPSFLCDLFDNDEAEFLMGRRDGAIVNCKLSTIGGLVEPLFQDSFNSDTIGGVYDRYIFGLCPGAFQYDYAPFEGQPENFAPVPVRIQHTVWEAKRQYMRSHPDMNPRLIEIAVRTAVICAAFSGTRRLNGCQLGPALELAKYQMNVRDVLQPNPGQTIEGKVAHKILKYVQRYGGSYVSRRQVLRDTRVYDLGPGIADRVIGVLKANGDIEVTKLGRQTVMRLIIDEEPETSEI